MIRYNKVLVTGGSGFVGCRLQRLKPEWIYVSSKDCDLTDREACRRLFEHHKPDAVIHLAAKVGGIKESSNNQAEFYYKNTMINMNVVHEAYRAGVKRMLASLSTCCFPDVSETYPMLEEDILSGQPTETNFCYGHSKRALYIQINAYRECYGVDYSTFCPSNLYGPENNFDLDKSHFVSSMVRKFSEAKDGDTVEFWGSGTPLRQQLYIDDLTKIIVSLLEEHHSSLPLIVAPNENLSIKQMIDLCLEATSKDLNIKFNNKLDGQYRKDGSNKRLLDLIGDFEFTTFKEGLSETCRWYDEQE